LGEGENFVESFFWVGAREMLEMIVEVALKEFSFEFGVFMELVGIVVELEVGFCMQLWFFLGHSMVESVMES
jgi:hypothetical protein